MVLMLSEKVPVKSVNLDALVDILGKKKPVMSLYNYYAELDCFE
jgi:hypothetical protein